MKNKYNNFKKFDATDIIERMSGKVQGTLQPLIEQAKKDCEKHGLKEPDSFLQAMFIGMSALLDDIEGMAVSIEDANGPSVETQFEWLNQAHPGRLQLRYLKEDEQ